MMTSAQVVETSVNVTTNSPSQDHTHLDDHNLPTYEMFSGSVFRGLLVPFVIVVDSSVKGILARLKSNFRLPNVSVIEQNTTKYTAK